MAWWFFSFKESETKEFIGGAVLEAATVGMAKMRALQLIADRRETIQAVAFELKDIPEKDLPSLPNRNRLLTHEEMERELGKQVQFEMVDGKFREVKDN